MNRSFLSADKSYYLFCYFHNLGATIHFGRVKKLVSDLEILFSGVVRWLRSCKSIQPDLQWRKHSIPGSFELVSTQHNHGQQTVKVLNLVFAVSPPTNGRGRYSTSTSCMLLDCIRKSYLISIIDVSEKTECRCSTKLHRIPYYMYLHELRYSWSFRSTARVFRNLHACKLDATLLYIPYPG